MKKLLAFALCLSLLCGLSSLMLTTYADDPEPSREMPDWIITELSPDQQGNGVGGWSTSSDAMEFIELVNTSGETLNLYDYCLTYNGNNRDSAKFEHYITEITPIKAGDYFDGHEGLDHTYETPLCDLSNKPVNPDTCEVAPGEVVVLWMMYVDAYHAAWNEGKGMSISDFRAFWSIPEDVKVIAVDALGTQKAGGHDKNFNVKNSKVGTYGIAKYTAELDVANEADTDGYEINYWEYDNLVCWATVDFIDQLVDGSKADATFQFTWDFAGYGAIDQSYTYIKGEDYVYDPGRCVLLQTYANATPGYLSTLQKATMGMTLTAGETVNFTDFFEYYYPLLGLGSFEGYIMGDYYYEPNMTFTADTDGVYTVDYKFENDGKSTLLFGTVEETEPPTEAATEAPTETPTELLTETPTEIPTGTESEYAGETTPGTEAAASGSTSTEETTDGGDGGCTSLVTMSCLCLLPLALVVLKKRRG